MTARRIYPTSNSDFNELAFGETKADINRETGEKSGERPGGWEKSEGGRGGGGRERRETAETSHRWPITPDNKHNLILYSFHLALRRGNPSPGIISDYLLAGANTPMRPHTHARRRLRSAHTRARMHACTQHAIHVYAFARYIFMSERWPIYCYRMRDRFSGGPCVSFALFLASSIAERFRGARPESKFFSYFRPNIYFDIWSTVETLFFEII